MKNFYTKSFLTFILSVSLPITGMAKQIIDNPSKDNNVRIEIDTSFVYPDNESDKIIEYLRKKYIDDKTFINNLNQKYRLNVTSNYSDEYFTDVYFDTPNLDLIKRNAELRHRIRKVVGATTPEKALIQLKMSNKDKLSDINNPDSRNEIKFAVKKGSAINGFDKPLNFITKKERDGFTNRFKPMGVNPDDLKPLFELNQHRRRIGLPLSDGQNFVGFSVDDVRVKQWWWTINYSQIELELNEITYTNASPSMRKEMEQVRNKMVIELRKQFPDLKPDSASKVSKAFHMLEKKIPGYAFLIKIGIF